jgi:myo-inositol 2-dehydrogenase/D-chiro-inositol 1-dehydrogenase
MRVGIIGTGTMGEIHAAAWQTTDAELVGCTSLHPAQREALAKRYNIRGFSDRAELLDCVDLVDICVPTFLHKSLVLDAARAHRHVICEKPIALTLEDAAAMIHGCNQAGVRLFVGMVVRFFPQYRLAKELVTSGQLGQLGVVRLKRVTYPPRIAETRSGSLRDNWYLDENRSGGMIIDLMIHDFDYARWLAGEVKRVYARRGRSATGPAQYTQAILRFQSGALALVEGGWANPAGIFRTAIDLSGSGGLVEWNSDQAPSVQTFFSSKSGEADSVGLPLSGLSEDPYTTEIQHAYSAIQSGSPFEVTAGDAFQALRIALAVKESLSTGRSVTV